jgi:hypothetical protein
MHGHVMKTNVEGVRRGYWGGSWERPIPASELRSNAGPPHQSDKHPDLLQRDGADGVDQER